MSAFADLLEELRPMLRPRERPRWEWDPSRPKDDPKSWAAWLDLHLFTHGASGEEALRKLVDKVREARSNALAKTPMR